MMGIALASVIGMGACTTHRHAREDLSTALEQHRKSRLNTAEDYAQTPTPQPIRGTVPAPEVAASSHHVPATLRDFIAESLDANPSILAARETARAKAERVTQVTSLPNPVMMIKLLPEAIRTAEGDNDLMIGITQKLPIPARLDQAGRLAMANVNIALAQLQETRLRVVAGVKQAYFQLYVIDKSIEITREHQELLRGLIDVARAQVAAGRRSQADVLRVQVELSSLEAELIALRQRRSTASARLNELRGRDDRTPIESPEDFGVRQAEIMIDDLLMKAADKNPRLQRLRQAIRRDRESVALAKLAAWPDFMIGFEWMNVDPRDAFRPQVNPATGRRPAVPTLSEEATDNWAISFGFTLPIWLDKIRAGEREAEHRLDATRQSHEAEKNRVSFQIEDAWHRVLAQQELASLISRTIIPQAEQTFQVSQASYIAGTSRFLDVIDNWRKWLRFNIQYHRTLGELERSVADLELALGLSLAEIGAP